MAELILSERTVAFAERDGGVYNDDGPWYDTPIELVAGETYTVIWDGDTYVCVAEAASFDGADGIKIGNMYILGGEPNTEEPFLLGYGYGMNLVYTSSNAPSHTIAVYKGAIEEDPPADEPEVVAPEEVNLSLYDRNGNTVIYSGIKTVTFNTDVEGTTATFSLGTAPDETTVVLDLKEGDQIVQNTETGLLKKVVIQQPEGLAPENIKKGVEIAGVEGTMIGTGVSKEVDLNDLDLSSGSDSVVADADTLMSEVVITKPDALVPENIVAGVEIAGIGGNASVLKLTDENLQYFPYQLDLENNRIVLYRVLYDLFEKDALGYYSVNIPDQIAGYDVVIYTK